MATHVGCHYFNIITVVLNYV